MAAKPIECPTVLALGGAKTDGEHGKVDGDGFRGHAISERKSKINVWPLYPSSLPQVPHW